MEDKQKISQILHNVIKDRDTTCSEVQTLSEQLQKALATIGELTCELQNTRVHMEQLQSQPQSQATTPFFSFTPQSLQHLSFPLLHNHSQSFLRNNLNGTRCLHGSFHQMCR